MTRCCVGVQKLLFFFGGGGGGIIFSIWNVAFQGGGGCDEKQK